MIELFVGIGSILGGLSALIFVGWSLEWLLYAVGLHIEIGYTDGFNKYDPEKEPDLHTVKDKPIPAAFHGIAVLGAALLLLSASYVVFGFLYALGESILSLL